MAFLGSVVVFTGSHNITLLWACVVGVFTVAVQAALVRPKLPTLGRMASVIGLVCLGLAVNAWYLLPDVLYAARTNVVADQRTYPTYAAAFFNTPQVLFDPLTRPPGRLPRRPRALCPTADVVSALGLRGGCLPLDSWRASGR